MVYCVVYILFGILFCIYYLLVNIILRNSSICVFVEILAQLEMDRRSKSWTESETVLETAAIWCRQADKQMEGQMADGQIDRQIDRQKTGYSVCHNEHENLER